MFQKAKSLINLWVQLRKIISRDKNTYYKGFLEDVTEAGFTISNNMPAVGGAHEALTGSWIEIDELQPNAE